MKDSDLITIDPDVLGGVPVFKGTRVPVKSLFDYLEKDYSLEEFLECFPSITKEMGCRVLERSDKVVPLTGYRLEISFPDGVRGIIDLSDSVGRGVFAPLQDETFFRKVYIGDYGQIAWSDELEICSDAAYLELMGKYQRQLAHA
jgi:uncharacterized protein (DUF433 family)